MLDSIVAQKHKEITTLRDKFSTMPLKGTSAFNPLSLKGGPVSIIAEVKKASPQEEFYVMMLIRLKWLPVMSRTGLL